jgi:hypothetical protein
MLLKTHQRQKKRLFSLQNSKAASLQSVNQNQSINQSVNQSISQSINQIYANSKKQVRHQTVNRYTPDQTKPNKSTYNNTNQPR